jgi:hypothetical protein
VPPTSRSRTTSNSSPTGRWKTLFGTVQTSLITSSATGATLPELMHRMGHSTMSSAARYLHATKDRDQVIAEALAELRPGAPVVDLEERRRRL